MEIYLLIGLLITLSILVFFKRKEFTWHRFGPFYFAMYKTQIGIKFLRKISSRHRKTLYWLGIIGISVGYIGMIIVCYDLIKGIYTLLSNPQMTVGLVLPIKAKGVFYVPLIYWIISVLLVMIVHEAGHGLIALVHKLNLKKTGIAFLGIIIPLIPAAFVEPDEKKLNKANNLTKLSVFAAGPFANILLGLILVLVYLTAMVPLGNALHYNEGVEIIDFMDKNTPAETSGIEKGEIIQMIDRTRISNIHDFKAFMDSRNIGDKIRIETNKRTVETRLTKDMTEGDAFLGVYIQDKLVLNEEVMNAHPVLGRLSLWLKDLIYWLMLLNIGVGLFNLVPIGPIDGGRMLQVALEKIMHQKRAIQVWKAVSYGLLVIIASNVIYALIG